MQVDLLIRNAQIVSPGGRQSGCVAVKDGLIAALGDEEALPPAGQTIDAQGKALIPGAIDLHVHFRDPGLTYKEDFQTGSMAAAAGGVTTVFDMPNTQPPVLDVESFEVKRRIAEEKSYVNFGLYAFLLDGNQHQIEKLIEAGIAGFKWDMSAADWELPPGFRVPDNPAALQAFRLIARHGYHVGVHAEEMSIVEFLVEELKAAGRSDYHAHVESRPDFVEVAAIQRAALLAEMTGCPLHVHHLSSRRGLEAIQRLRGDGLPVTCEVGPHWFLFCSDDYERMGSRIKTHPAVKDREDAEALWQGLRDGTIDCLATDHAPHSHEEKFERSWHNASPGADGVETSMALMLDKVNAGELPLERYVAFACENPARIYGLYPRKGTIQIGSDADLVLLDMDLVWTITDEGLYSKNHITPFHGWTIKGKPVLTMVNGQVVMRDGEITGSPAGKLVNPKQTW